MRTQLKILLISCLCILRIQAQEQKLLFIGIDGCRGDAIFAADAPVLQELITGGVHSLDMLTLYPTWSGNGWSTMLTGVLNNKHNVTNNSFTDPNYDQYPDFITRLEAFDAELETVSIVHWAPINDQIIQVADHELSFPTDAEVRTSAVSILTTSDPDVVFIDFDDVDHAGHSFGFDTDIPQYLASIEVTDNYVDDIMNAIESRENYENENWLVIVTSDHGGNSNGHGLGTLEERKTFITANFNNLFPIEVAADVKSNEVTGSFPLFTEGMFAVPVDQSDFNFGADQDFTIELWVKTDVGFDADPSFVSNKDWDSGLNPGFVISAQSGSVWKVNIGDGETRADLQGGEIDNEWTHLAVSFDRDGLMKAYEDGAIVGIADISAIGDINSGLPLVINQDGTTSYDHNFEGQYREIRIWNSVIDEKTLVDWATYPLLSFHPNYQNLLANWVCGDVNTSILVDSGPGVNHCEVNSILTGVESTEVFSIRDYTEVPRMEDNALTALEWFCVPIDPLWDLDGESLFDLVCETGTKDIESDFVKIHPNPTNGYVAIQTNEIIESVKVYSVTGKLLLDQKGQNYVDLSGFPNGQYIIEVSTPRGRKMDILIKH